MPVHCSTNEQVMPSSSPEPTTGKCHTCDDGTNSGECPEVSTDWVLALALSLLWPLWCLWSYCFLTSGFYKPYRFWEKIRLTAAI